MTIEVDFPRYLELSIKADRRPEALVRRKIEHQIAKEVKDDLFLCMALDDLFKEGDLTEEDVNEIYHKMKRNIMENLG
jgi:hypothetical protein